jgi:hypothetical protein
MEFLHQILWQRLKRGLPTILVSLFLLILLSGFTAGLMAAACKKDRHEAEKKVRYCSISLAAGAWADLLPLERARRSMIRLERAIALAQVERTDEARVDFKRAIDVMLSSRISWLQEDHMRRIARLENKQIEALWLSVLDAYD